MHTQLLSVVLGLLTAMLATGGAAWGNPITLVPNTVSMFRDTEA